MGKEIDLLLKLISFLFEGFEYIDINLLLFNDWRYFFVEIVNIFIVIV